jgi:hypothetical protein
MLSGSYGGGVRITRVKCDRCRCPGGALVVGWTSMYVILVIALVALAALGGWFIISAAGGKRRRRS